MAILVKEQKESRRIRASVGSSTEIDYVWKVTGTYDPDEVITALIAVRPLTVLDPVWGHTLIPSSLTSDPLGAGVWQCVITYLDAVKHDEIRQLDTGESRFAFSTTGGTLHIKSSLERMGQYTLAPAYAKDNGTLIGVTDDGVEGIDIVIPVMSFQIDYRHPKAVITHAFRRTLGLMTATTNNATFFTHPAGEVLYLGADGAQGNKSDPQLSHQFVQGDNLTDQVIGGISGIAKKGHEYVDVYYETIPNPTGSGKRKRAIRVDVHRLYEASNFADLLIGTS